MILFAVGTPGKWEPGWWGEREGWGVYHAKKFLSLCIPIPASRPAPPLSRRSSRFLHGTAVPDYYELLPGLRSRFLIALEKGGVTLPELRRMDAPEKYPAFDRQLISLPRCGVSYCAGSFPEERQVGLVLDKCFYHPKGGSGELVFWI